MKVSRRFLNLSGGAAGLVVLVCIAVALNIILSNFSLRKDLTEEKLYVLSDGTGQILRNLEEPVTLKFFFNASSPEVPMHLKSFAGRVEDLLVEYEMAGRGNVVVEKYDPKPDSDAEDWAHRYGVTGQPIGFMGPAMFIGLVTIMGDVEAVIPVLDPRTESLLEYNITRMITRVSNPEKPVIGVLSSLPVLGTERPPYAMPGQPQPEPRPAWFAFSDLRQDYDVRKIETTVEEIDEEVDALILVHPKGLSDETLYAIDQFVLRGGKLLAFLDPMCVTEAETQPAPQMQFARNASELGRLLDAWGVTFDTAKVVADLEASSRLRVGQGGRVEESPVWLTLRGGHLNAEDILTAQIETIMLPYAGALTADDSADVEVTSLLASSESSGLVDAMTAQFSIDGVRRGFRSGLKRLDLAGRLYGKLATAFPEGKPSADEDEDEESDDDGKEKPEAEDVEPAGLKESIETSTVVLVGDVDMLYDRFCVQEMNFFGYKAHQPMNDNLALFANTIEQIAGSTALVKIRTRGKTDRPFDVVLDLQRNAQEKYMAEETRLQERLTDAQRRLGELQSKKDEKQRFILSAQQKREIQNFQRQVAKTKKELKLVRRKLREDIERLGMKVKAINILLMPALVSLVGVGFGLFRRKRTKN